MNELTEEEMIHYANFSLIDICDCCGDYVPITNYHEGDIFLTFTGKQFLCNKCFSGNN